MLEKISLNFGDGGSETQTLIHEVFYRYFNNNLLKNGLDGAFLELDSNKVVFTTDSFVVDPLFFNGGDIGKLAVNGTVNDLVVSGAIPEYLSCSFIIEEGFERDTLEKIVQSMSKACHEANVQIVTGDTKVVPKGNCGGIYINTAGIGRNDDFRIKPLCVEDEIIITGTIAEHGTEILLKRHKLNVQANFKSDCAPLIQVWNTIRANKNEIKVMKDITRGGLASVLNELSQYFKKGIEINESSIPIRSEVKAIGDILGIDPMYLASEGCMLILTNKGIGAEIVRKLRKNGYPDSCLIGKVTEDSENLTVINTVIGGKRVLYPLENLLLPRMC